MVVAQQVLLKSGSSRLHVDETTAPVLDPGRGRTKTGYLWAVLRDDWGWNGAAAPGVVFHYHPGRKGEYADTILMGFDGVPSRLITLTDSACGLLAKGHRQNDDTTRNHHLFADVQTHDDQAIVDRADQQ